MSLLDLLRRSHKPSPYWHKGWVSGLQEVDHAQQAGISLNHCFLEQEVGIIPPYSDWYGKWYRGRAASKVACIKLAKLVSTSLTAQTLAMDG